MMWESAVAFGPWTSSNRWLQTKLYTQISFPNPILDCVDLRFSFREEEIAGVIEEGGVSVVHEKEGKILFTSTCTSYGK